MKKFKDFFESIEPEITTNTNEEVVVEVPHLQLMDEPNQLFWEEDGEQKQNHHNPMDPPAVLIMRRKSIRQFPNNQRVALYYVDKINKYVTVPYTAMQWTSIGEETNVIEEEVDAIAQLQKIKDTHQMGTVKHKDGSSSKIDAQTAHAVLTVHKALNAENKKKYADMAGKSKQHMQKAADFAWKHLK